MPAFKTALISPIHPDLLEKDIQQLLPTPHLVATRSQYQIFIAPATLLPHILLEIGRLRELSFRAVGEGTGKALDIDVYDQYYHQLFIWDRHEKRVVGGYRLGKGDEILTQKGVTGCYTHSLFNIATDFYPILRKSIELGRSYIVPDYQKKHLPLFLLWKGILFFLLQHPQYQYLYGPVSISKYYSNVSKNLIVAFVKKHYFHATFAQYFSPRQQFKPQLRAIDKAVLAQSGEGEWKKLDRFIEQIEPQHLKVPILLKQYVKLNARFLSFNIDPNFSEVLDGLMLLDINEVPPHIIAALKKQKANDGKE